MAEQIKYISENGRLYIDETQQVVDSLCDKLKQMGAQGIKSNHMIESGAFEFNGKYEFPRQGAVLFHFKELAERPLSKLPDSFNYNVYVDLLGFKEDTKKYKKIKSSIEDILNVEYFDKI